MHSPLCKQYLFIAKRINCAEKNEICSHVKVTAVCRVLLYGLLPDAIDKYQAMSTKTIFNAMKRYCAEVIYYKTHRDDA